MSERCPGCRRTVGVGDARCPRCGTSLLGVELEADDGVFTGNDVVVGGRSGRATSHRSRRARVGAVLAVAAVVAGVVAIGRVGSRTATTTTTATTSADDPVTSTTAPATTAAPASSATDSADTTTTTIDRREIRSEAEGWTATVTRRPGLGTLVFDGGRAERTGLTMAVVNDGNGASVQFTDLDTGGNVSVTVGILSSSGGGGFTVPQLFAGGAVVQLQVRDPGQFVSLLVHPDGSVRSLDGVGALVDTFGSSSSPVLAGAAAWFFDRADGHVLHLVDLTTATTLRSLTIPAVTTAIGVDGDDPVVLDAAGQQYTVAADGTARPAPLEGSAPRLPTGARRMTLDCDADLAACTQTYHDEAGNRTTLLGADQALTTSALPAPAGPPLVALVPVTPCRDACRFSGPPPPSAGGRLQVVDAATGVRLLDVETSARVIGGPFGGVFGAYSGVAWSTDGRWLFYPVPGRTRQLGAWRPGLVDPLTLTLDVDVAGDGSFGGPATAFFPSPTVVQSAIPAP